jgi:hypothetical protein
MIGAIYQQYRRREIEADDEVAVTFDDECRPCTTPLVNVRHMAARAVEAALLSPDEGAALVAAARALPYTERSLPHMLRRAGLGDPTRTLAAKLRRWDLKADDARALLRAIADAMRA